MYRSFCYYTYYCVIGGWVIKYFVTFLTGDVAAAAGDEYFNGFISQAGSPVFCVYIIRYHYCCCSYFRRRKGIEKASRIMMPLLIVLIIGVSVFCIERPWRYGGCEILSAS